MCVWSDMVCEGCCFVINCFIDDLAVFQLDGYEMSKQ